MNREVTSTVSLILDRFIPLVVRESRWFYKFILRFAVGGDVNAYLDFRDNVWKMSPEEIQAFYKSVHSNIERPTDCNAKSIKRIMDNIDGKTVLEFGCGRGYLARKIIDKGFKYTGVDFDISGTTNDSSLSAGNFIEATDLTELIEEGVKYDTVVCTHTLEHLLDIRKGVNELLELTNRQILIVVPLQLNLYYTPDLHTYFFRRPGDFFIASGLSPVDYDIAYHIDKGDLFVCVKKR